MNKIINNIIISSIFIVPISAIIPISGTVVWYPQLLALMALGFVCLSMIFWNTNKFISLFLMYTIFSYIFVCAQSPRSMLCLITGFGGIMFSYLVSRSDTKNIKKALAIFAVINFIYVILQIFNIDPFFATQSNSLIDRTVGFMGSRNQLGIFFATVSTMMCPWLCIFIMPILLVKCSSALAGLCIGLNTFLFLKGYKKSALGVAVFLIIIGVGWVKLGYKSGEISERVGIWKLSISQTINGKIISDGGSPVIKCNPLFGYGLGNFFIYSPHSQGSVVSDKDMHRYEHAHNDLVEAFFEFGYIGLILIFLCIYKVISDFIECLHIGHPNTKNLIITFCSLITLSICSMGVYVFHAPVSLFLFCLFLGLFYREVNHAKQGTIT